MTRIITRLSIFFIGAVFGLCVGVAIGLWFTWATIGRECYETAVEIQAMDNERFYKQQMILLGGK